jgi:regulator of sigma E protease
VVLSAFGVKDPTEEHLTGPDSDRSFVKKSRPIQAAVLVAGVAMNVLLAFVLFTAAFMYGMPVEVDETNSAQAEQANLLISSVMSESPASESLKASDTILSVRSGDEVIPSEDIPLHPSAVANFVSSKGGEEVVFEVMRRGESLTVSVTPVYGVIPDQPERAAAGFTMSLVAMERLPLHKAVVVAGERTYQTLIAIVVGISTLFMEAVRGTADFSQVAGPVGIVGLVGDAASLGFSWLLIFTAFISLNLAIINLLPIPALDGGRLLFVIIESITRRPIPSIVATRMNQVGFIFLLTLMALVTVNDVVRLF